jgi:hypothetical protein
MPPRLVDEHNDEADNDEHQQEDALAPASVGLVLLGDDELLNCVLHLLRCLLDVVLDRVEDCPLRDDEVAQVAE